MVNRVRSTISNNTILMVDECYNNTLLLQLPTDLLEYVLNIAIAYPFSCDDDNNNHSSESPVMGIFTAKENWQVRRQVDTIIAFRSTCKAAKQASEMLQLKLLVSSDRQDRALRRNFPGASVNRMNFGGRAYASRSPFTEWTVDVNANFQDQHLVDAGCIFQHQKDAAMAAVNHLKDGGRSSIALVVQPTGTGKSAVAVLVSYLFGARKVLVITPSKIIATQLNKDFADPKESFLVKRCKHSSCVFLA